MIIEDGMLNVTAAVVLGLLGLVLALWFQYRRNLLSTIKRLNIPGPEPNLIFGNMKEIWKKGSVETHKEWRKKYGNVYGYYIGARPAIVISDLDILKNVLIKDFQNFINRPIVVPGGLHQSKIFSQHILRQRDQKWRNMRAILTPSFTSGKLKQMGPILNEALNEFISHVDRNSKEDNDFDIYAMYKALTLDVIGRTAFGIESGVQKNPKTDDFLLAVQDALREDSISGLTALTVLLPELRFILQPFRLLSEFLRVFTGKSRFAELAARCEAIIKARRQNPQNRRQDLLQLMLDAQITQKEMQDISAEALTAGRETDEAQEEKSSNDKVKSDEKKTFHMSDDEVLSNTFVVLFAGFDTTSTALGFTTHVLVNRQDIQDRIREEVQEVFRKDGSLDFTNVTQCKYLDQVLHESLRYYTPVASGFSRECSSDITYGDLHIPKGISVQIPYFLHRDPDLWTDPDTFDPERFSPENKVNIHPLAFQAFGTGPRNCIGMRFAQMEAKLALANLLLKYRLVPGDRTEIGDIQVVYKVMLMNPKNGVFVKAQKIET